MDRAGIRAGAGPLAPWIKIARAGMEAQMIVELVLFDLPEGATRASAAALYETTAARWADNPDLIEKYYYFDAETGEGGGVYIWPDRAAAERWHGEDYRRMIAKLYGASPRIRILDALMHVAPGAIRQL